MSKKLIIFLIFYKIFIKIYLKSTILRYLLTFLLKNVPTEKIKNKIKCFNSKMPISSKDYLSNGLFLGMKFRVLAGSILQYTA